MRKVAYFFLRLYKKTLSPIIGQNCRFFPTCSAYTYQAITKYGTFRGSWMGFWRIMRCNPISRGGYDPVRENIKGKSKWII